MSTIAVLAALLTGLQGTEERYSGPQKGEALPGFTVYDGSGPGKGKEVDFIGEFKGAPTLLVFIHKFTRVGSRLIREVDRIAQDRADLGLKAVFVILDDDPFKVEKYVPILQKSLGVKTPIGVSIDGAEGPGAYGLNKEMEQTILVAKDNKVTYNLALVGPNETFAEQVEKAVDAVLEVPELSPKEMAEQLRQLQMEVRRLKRDLDALRKQQQNAMMRRPNRKTPPKRDE